MTDASNYMCSLGEIWFVLRKFKQMVTICMSYLELSNLKPYCVSAALQKVYMSDCNDNEKALLAINNARDSINNVICENE